MSLKNYIFASINTKSYGNTEECRTLPHNYLPPICERPNTSLHPSSDSLLKRALKIWQYVSVEPIMLCWLLPSCFLLIAVENLALEKSCRVNFGYPDIVCDNMIDKSLNNIDCVIVRNKIQEAQNNLPDIINESIFNSTLPSSILDNILNITQLEFDVCNAEIDSQRLDTQLNVYTSPFDTVFGIIMILFAGGWSDRKGIRKPCILLPIFGELAALIVLLISAIFMKQLPLEFTAVLVKLLPAMSGGLPLMYMGVYSYLTEMTKEEDRTFRFGIFAVFVPLITVFAVPFSWILYQRLGYIRLLFVCLPINVIGILYTIFVLKEVKHEPKTNSRNNNATPIENLTFEPSEMERSRRNSRRNTLIINDLPHHPNRLAENLKKNCLVEFFNPIVAIESSRVILKHRKRNGRRIIILIFIAYFIAAAPAFGEEPNEYNFTRIRLNWSGLQYSPLVSYGSGIGLVGTILMVGGLSKIFKISDPVLGVICTIFSSIARILFTAASTATMLYMAKTADMFVSVRIIILKSVVSTYVDVSELGRIFSIIGIIEVLSKFASVSTYSLIYEHTLESFPGAFYLVSLACLIITGIMFSILYFIVKKKRQAEALEKQELDKINENLGTTSENQTNHTETNQNNGFSERVHV